MAKYEHVHLKSRITSCINYQNNTTKYNKNQWKNRWRWSRREGKRHTDEVGFHRRVETPCLFCP